MQRSRIASAAISAFILLPACSLIIDSNPDGVITEAGANGKGKGGSSSAGASSANGGSAVGDGGRSVTVGGTGTLSGGTSNVGTAGDSMTGIGGVVETGSGGLGASGASGASGTGIGGVATTSGGTTGSLGGATTAGGATGTSGATAVGGATGASGATSKGGAAGAGIGGANVGGGTATTGGAVGVGGKATGGTPPSAGGVATGGVGTGGAIATGGRNTGGATAAATGGALNQFVSGPCVTSVDLTNVEVFANGGNQKIYRRVINGANYGTWASIAGLDAALLDVRSKLDCSSDGTTVHIAASGSNPIGRYMHATGSGTLYNQFVQELASASFGLGVSIASTTTVGRYDMAAVNSGQLTWVDVFNGGTSPLTPPLTNQLTSSPDLAIQNAPNSAHFLLVAFDTSASMVFFDYVISASPASWWPAQYVSPPASTTFAFAPTLCTESVISTGNFTRHIAAVAGGKVWYAYSGTGWPTAFSAWEAVSTIAANSAPDCVVTADGTVHVVALSSTGTVVDIHGKTGNFTTTDLGGY